MKIDVSREAISSLPSLDEMGVSPRILEAAEEMLCSYETGGVEPSKIEHLLRLVAYHLLCPENKGDHEGWLKSLTT